MGVPFVILGKWTEQGIRNVRDAPKRAEDARKWAEAHGCKLWTWYTLGEYDFMSVLDAPNDETAFEFALNISKMGNARTKTLKAWSSEDAAKVIGKVA
jgi:uncharacterized protein with GYD domain